MQENKLTLVARSAIERTDEERIVAGFEVEFSKEKGTFALTSRSSVAQDDFSERFFCSSGEIG